MTDSEKPIALLREKLRSHDAVLMTIVEVDRQQVVGKLETAYSKRFEGNTPYEHGLITFVGSPSTWGNVSLKQGERALVFLRNLGKEHGDKLYQEHWRGHFTVMDIQGVLCGVANWDLISPNATWEPSYLRKAAFRSTELNPYQTAMPYALLEEHLLDELKQAACASNGGATSKEQ